MTEPQRPPLTPVPPLDLDAVDVDADADVELRARADRARNYTDFPEVAAIMLGTSQYVLAQLRADWSSASEGDQRAARARYAGAMRVHDALLDTLIRRGLDRRTPS